MNHYQQEINRLKNSCYANEAQIQTMIAARRFIAQHFDRELKLDTLAHTCFTSKFHLLRTFKRYYGLTPKQYLTDTRIERAKDYLKNGMTVTGTCFTVGFECPSSFSTLFRLKVGLSPAEFQKRAIFAK